VKITGILSKFLLFEHEDFVETDEIPFLISRSGGCFILEGILSAKS